MATGLLNLPDELLTQILLNASTPTFIQLILSCKKFFVLASQTRKVLLHQLECLPGDKSKFKDDSLDNNQIFLLLRQRAANVLTGSNFTANLHEYITRDVPIDPDASSVGGLDADYVRMALCFKDSADIRQYTSHCAIKEKIKNLSALGTKVLRLVQWGRFVSVLCASPVSKTDDFSDASDTDQSESETEMLIKSPFIPTANARLQRAARHAKPRTDRLVRALKIDQCYQVIHFDVYTMEDSQTFDILPPINMVPRDFAVQSNSLCAILWDKSAPGQRPTEDANVVTYTIDARMDDIVYEQKTVWPKSGKPARTDADSDDDDLPEDLPERMAFFKDGRRIKMYNAGGVVPYQIFSTSTTQYDQYASTNVIQFDGFSVLVDTPFFGTHTTQLDEINQQSYCFQHHLCLGVATLNMSIGANEDEVKVLCILRSHNRYYPDGCEHRVSLSRMTHVSANNSTIVARLWGWEEMHSSFSGKDVVAVSPGGTRIAIAMWDKILVYPLNPKVLCDEVVVDSSDDESNKLKKKKKKMKKSWETACTDYYHRPKDGNFLDWRVAEIRPIVLDLQGAIAHKMSWSQAKGPVTDTEDLSASSSKDSDADADKDSDVVAEENTDQMIVSAVAIENGANFEVPVTEDVPLPPSTSVIAQESLVQGFAQEADGSSSILPSTVPASEPQEPTAETSNSVSAIVTQPVVGNSPADLQPGQISPIEPQSPSQPTKKKEDIQPVGTLGASAPTSPLPMLSSFSNGLSSNPFAPYNSINQSPVAQPSKASIRKKEKGIEVNSGDVVGLAQLEKKSPSAFSLGPHEGNMSQDVSPSSPPISAFKSGCHLGQVAADSVVVSNSAAVKNISSLGSTNAALTTNVTTVPQHGTADIGTISPISETNTVTKSETDEEDDVATNHSKNPCDATTNPVNLTNDTDENGAKLIKRKKRITEDELVVLTDRGVQVWNMGARARGKRKKSLLKMEEGLKGKLPRMKGKAKEVVVHEEYDDD